MCRKERKSKKMSGWWTQLKSRFNEWRLHLPLNAVSDVKDTTWTCKQTQTQNGDTWSRSRNDRNLVDYQHNILDGRECLKGRCEITNLKFTQNAIRWTDIPVPPDLLPLIRTNLQVGTTFSVPFDIPFKRFHWNEQRTSGSKLNQPWP